MRRGEEQTRLTRESETKDQALADNTNALTKFSDRLATWMATNPAASTMLGGEKGSAIAMVAQDASSIYGEDLAKNSAARGGGVLGNMIASMNPMTLVSAIREAVLTGSREGVQGATITATVDPHTASQAAGGAASERAQ